MESWIELRSVIYKNGHATMTLIQQIFWMIQLNKITILMVVSFFQTFDISALKLRNNIEYFESNADISEMFFLTFIWTKNQFSLVFIVSIWHPQICMLNKVFVQCLSKPVASAVSAKRYVVKILYTRNILFFFLQ